MTEIVFMPPEERERHYRAVMKKHIAADRRKRFSGSAKTLALVGSAALIGWLSWCNARLAERAVNTDVVYAVIRDDGTLTNSVRFSALPREWRDKTEMNALWRYVLGRECYNGTRAAEDWHVVRAMSDVRVAKEFSDWFHKDNKSSPQHVYGDQGNRVDCSFVGLRPLGADRVEILFDRWLVTSRGKTDPVRYVAVIHYRTGVYPSDPQQAWIDKATFNAPGIQVIEYPASTPEAVAHNEASSR